MAKKRNQYGVKQRNKRWIASPYIPGRRERAWAGTFDTEAEATKAAIEKIEELRKLPAAQESIASFAKRWNRDFPRPKESTNDAYKGAAKRFAERVDPDERRKLNEFTVPEAMSYARLYPYDVPPLRAMYGDARREGLVLEVPFSTLGISKGRGRKDIVAITRQELAVLAQVALDAHGRDFGPVFRSILIFAAYTTMRPSEVFGLDRPDLQGKEVAIDRQFHKRRIQTPKYGRRRLPFIPPQAREALSELPRRVPPSICPITGNEILFTGKEGQRITQASLSSYWKPVKVAFEAQLSPERREQLRTPRNPKDPTMDFYELRHYGATVMAEAGVEPWVAAKMMGHNDGGKLFEDTYSHPRDEIARERLERAFRENVKPLRAVDDEEAANG